jgi:hypothetical protein
VKGGDNDPLTSPARHLRRGVARVSTALVALVTSCAARCALCPRGGKLREYRSVSVVLCACCAFDVELAVSTPEEIATEVSCAVNAMVAR